MVKEYIEKFSKSGEYEKIESFIESYEISKDEFLEMDVWRTKGWWWMICFMTLIIIVGLVVGLEKTNILIKSLYISPFAVISFFTFKSHIKVNEEEYSNYKNFRKDVLWQIIYITSFVVYFIPVIGSLLGINLTNDVAIKMFVGGGVAISLVSLYFYNIGKKELVKKYSKKKKNESSKLNLISIFTGGGAMIGIVYTRKYGGGPWMLMGAAFVGIVALKCVFIAYWEYKIVDFMENEIKSYLKSNKKCKKKK